MTDYPWSGKPIMSGKNIGQLNAIIERKETNVKFEFVAAQFLANFGQKWIFFIENDA